MSKSELIAAIRRLNRTVSAEFLERFGETDLRAYLERIVAVLGPPQPEPHAAQGGLSATVDAHQEFVIA